MQPPFTHRRMESSARPTPPSFFLSPLLHVFLIYIIYIRFIPIFVGLNNHLSMWTFQEVTLPLHPSARCHPCRISLKAFLSSKGSISSDLFIFLHAFCSSFYLICNRSSTSSNTKSTLGPRVLPKLPQKGQFLLNRKLPRWKMVS